MSKTVLLLLLIFIEHTHKKVCPITIRAFKNSNNISMRILLKRYTILLKTLLCFLLIGGLLSFTLDSIVIEEEDCVNSDYNILNLQDSSYFYIDIDGDGLGNIDSSIYTDNQPSGYVQNYSDCDDSDSHNSSCVTFVVNTTDDNDDGNCNSAHCSLREAINESNNNNIRALIMVEIETSYPAIELDRILPPIINTKGTSLVCFNNGYLDSLLTIGYNQNYTFTGDHTLLRLGSEDWPKSYDSCIRGIRFTNCRQCIEIINHDRAKTIDNQFISGSSGWSSSP